MLNKKAEYLEKQIHNELVQAKVPHVMKYSSTATCRVLTCWSFLADPSQALAPKNKPQAMLHMKKKARYAKQQESINGQVQNLEAQV
jgi:hypothetical protein